MQANEIKIAERGEQWRLLSVGEVIERGDEYLARLPDHWIASESSGDLLTNSNVIYRRRIEPRPVAKPIPEAITPIPGMWYEIRYETGRYFCVGKNESGEMLFRSEDYPSDVLWHFDSSQILREYAKNYTAKPASITPIPGMWYEIRGHAGTYFCAGQNESGGLYYHYHEYHSLLLKLRHFDSSQILRECAETESISRAEAAENQSYADLAASGGIVDAP